MAHHPTHPFHILPPSPWPILGALAALCLGGGAVLFMHDYGPWVLSLGGGILIFTLLGWGRDIIQESKTDHTPQIQQGFRYGMALFIFSEVMFFVAFFWAFFDASLFPAPATGGVWPPHTVHPLNPFELPYLNTLLLLLSGTTLTGAHHALIEGTRKEMQQKLLFTVILGASFLGVQAYEYAHATFAFTGGIYSSTFYMTTGFHGFHVFIGVILLMVCLCRARLGHFTPRDHFGFEAAAWYWHFVDVVWLFLFVSIYLWGS